MHLSRLQDKAQLVSVTRFINAQKKKRSETDLLCVQSEKYCSFGWFSCHKRSRFPENFQLFDVMSSRKEFKTTCILNISTICWANFLGTAFSVVTVFFLRQWADLPILPFHGWTMNVFSDYVCLYVFMYFRVQFCKRTLSESFAWGLVEIFWVETGESATSFPGSFISPPQSEQRKKDPLPSDGSRAINKAGGKNGAGKSDLSSPYYRDVKLARAIHNWAQVLACHSHLCMMWADFRPTPNLLEVFRFSIIIKNHLILAACGQPERILTGIASQRMKPPCKIHP